MKLNNKLYKLAMKTHYNNFDSKIGLYQRYASYCSRKLRINREPINSYRTMLIELDISQQYKENSSKKKERNHKKYFIYSKPSYFTKEYYLNKIVKQKQINAILKNNPEI